MATFAGKNIIRQLPPHYNMEGAIPPRAKASGFPCANIMKQEFTETESDYVAYLQESDRTTEELMTCFGAKRRAVYQILNTLRLKRSVIYINEPDQGMWKYVDNPNDVALPALTPLRREYLEYLVVPWSTNSISGFVGCSYQSAIQMIRVLRLLGYVIQDGKTWKITDAGLKALEEDK